MQVERYDEHTKERIIAFLKKQREAITSEIVRLGTKKRVVNWQTLKMILAELEHDGLVQCTRIGRKVKVYRWNGGE